MKTVYSTKTLRNGLTVLARLRPFEGGVADVITYANRSQAAKAAQKHGGHVWNRYGSVFYVVLNGLPLEL